MKTLFSFFAILFVAVSFSYAQDIKFESTEINYGTIDKGADGVRIFKFSNTGTAPLIISNAQGSCGCTVPTYPKEPIMPGEKGEIRVKYDTQRVGAFTKYVTLTSNATSGTSTQLKIAGDVKPEPAPTPEAPKNLFNNGN
jgi:hypothetical protein